MRGEASPRTDQGWTARPEHEPQTAQGNSGRRLFRWMRELAPHFFNVEEMPALSWHLGGGAKRGSAAAEGFSRLPSCSPCRDLSNNQIAEIAPDAFQGLRSLNSL